MISNFISCIFFCFIVIFILTVDFPGKIFVVIALICIAFFSFCIALNNIFRL